MAIVVKINQFLLAAVILGNVQLIAMDLKSSDGKFQQAYVYEKNYLNKSVDMCKKMLIKEEQELFKKERVLGEIINSLEDYRNQVNLINDKKCLMSELGYEAFGMQVMQGVSYYQALLNEQNEKCLASQKKVTAIRNNLALFQGCADELNEKKRQLETDNAIFSAQKKILMNDKSINTLL